MQTKPQASVSVVIPCFNCEDTIRRAVTSVAEQTWRPKEVILVVDDGSTDQTLSRLREIGASFEPSWIKVLEIGENGGPSVARNAGWNVATQPYLTFLDADDAWHPHKVEIQLKYMQAYPTVAITGHRSRWLREGEESSPISEQHVIKPVTKRMMLVSNRLFTSTVMLKKDLDVRFDPAKRHSEDYLLWLRIICCGYKAAFIDLDLAYIYKAPYGMGGLSGQLLAMERGELDTYRTLCNEQQISLPAFIVLSAFSIIKFVRRVMISRLLVRRYEE